MAVVEVGKLSYPYCQKVLPLVYDDSLSYYENICQFITKLNEMADAINNISVDILEQANSYTDTKVAQSLVEVNAKIAELRELIDDTTEEFNRILAEADAKYTRFENKVNNQLIIFNQALENIRAEINADIIGVNARTDLAIQQNNDYIFDVINNTVLSHITVINMFTGARVTVQEMFNYLGNLHTEEGTTINFMVSADKTVKQIVAINADCTDWVRHGRTLLSA